jgi:hypothetical protein
MSRYSGIDLTALDIDWFAVDQAGSPSLMRFCYDAASHPLDER